jgi:hypothetical protein
MLPCVVWQNAKEATPRKAAINEITRCLELPIIGQESGIIVMLES